ncbi:hypothetical protein MOQ72_19895 [Saccharopolyspora sp. K220]|uniref:hypothetical protein n=1 Tax=Saccharopolyspora soli TaxID=2926618 RepID=UPI001F57C8DB|nr:hypothetical protein [Saccharopolyspora soli]MCI2419712.1 hypothetical protein [Saccharopolyspora soli]
MDVVVPKAGVSANWAYKIERHLAEAGLVDLHTLHHRETVTGGTTGCLLYRNYVQQAEAPLLANGLTEDELRSCCDLLLDPRFRTWFYLFICSRARKPIE